jgi:hypothetical protein
MNLFLEFLYWFFKTHCPLVFLYLQVNENLPFT